MGLKAVANAGGGGTVTGTGTPGTLAKFATASSVGDSAVTQAAGAIATVTLTAGGAGYTNGTYAAQALTGGAGTGATADFVVAGGIVTVCVLRAPGVGYLAADVLSCATIGAGAGLIVTVATVVAAVSTTGNVTANRLGAGTTNPRAGLDVASGGALVSTSTPFVNNIWSGSYQRTESHLAIGNAGPAANLAPGIITLFGLSYDRGLNANPTGSTGTVGIALYPRFETSAAGLGANVTSVSAFSVRSYAADLSVIGNLTGVSALCGVLPTTGSTATNEATAYLSQISASMVGHTITTAHNLRGVASNAGTITTLSGIRLQPITGTGSIGTFYGLRIEATTTNTITNRWGISQEDTLATNYFAGNVGIGTPTAGSLLTVAGVLAFDSGYGSAAPAYGCRAWVKFDGTGTPAIASSGNVSSITDLGIGNWGVNYTTAMVDANYAVFPAVAHPGGAGTPLYATIDATTSAPTTAQVRVFTLTNINAQVDAANVYVAVFR